MQRKWRPFRHLQGDEDLADEALNDYRKALTPYDTDVLERAWELVVARHRFPCWPYESEFLDAARQAQRELRPAGQGDAWVAKATEMTDQYTRRFMKASTVAAKAREGGYERELREYVRAAAWVQAQMILGLEDRSLQANILFPWHPRDLEAEQEFYTKAREQAATGQIKVVAPRDLIKQWMKQERAEGHGRSK